MKYEIQNMKSGIRNMKSEPTLYAMPDMNDTKLAQCQAQCNLNG